MTNKNEGSIFNLGVDTTPRDANREEFELAELEHEIVKKYQPKFLAKGGEHIVYEVADHPEIVAKVDINTLKMIVDWNAADKRPIDTLEPEDVGMIREYLDRSEARYKALKQYFGAEHVLGQKRFLVKVPITDNILRQIYNGPPPITGDEVWSLVTIQKQVKDLAAEKHLTPAFDYAEKKDVNPEAYDRATKRFIFGKESERSVDEEMSDFIAVQLNNDLKRVVRGALDDKNLEVVLEDFVRRSINYAAETGEIIDLAGTDNVVFLKENGQWTYKLIDALYPDHVPLLGQTQTIVHKLSTGEEISMSDRGVLMNAFNFIRTINGLAEILEMPERINIVPEGMGDKPIDFLTLIRERFKSA